MPELQDWEKAQEELQWDIHQRTSIEYPPDWTEKAGFADKKKKGKAKSVEEQLEELEQQESIVLHPKVTADEGVLTSLNRKLDQKLFLLAHDSATQKWVFPWVERAAEAEPTVRSTVEEFLQIMDPNGQFYPVGNCPIAHIPSQGGLFLYNALLVRSKAARFTHPSFQEMHWLSQDEVLDRLQQQNDTELVSVCQTLLA